MRARVPEGDNDAEIALFTLSRGKLLAGKCPLFCKANGTGRAGVGGRY